MTISDIHQECNYEASLLADQNKCLQSELSELRESAQLHSAWNESAYKELRTEYGRLQSENAQLRAECGELRKYARHTEECDTTSYPPQSCDCGFAALSRQKPVQRTVNEQASESRGEQLYDRLLDLEPNGNFLPASVACDYAGKCRFIAWLDKQISDIESPKDTALNPEKKP